MKFLGSLAEFLYWAFRTVLTLVIALMLVRALIEFVPRLEVLPPARALVRFWDPTMADLLAPFGLSWSHDVRSLFLPGAAIALILMRTAMEGAFAELFRPAAQKPKPKPKAISTGVEEALSAGAPPPTTQQMPVTPAPPPPRTPPPDDPNSTGFRPALAPEPPSPPRKATRIGRYDLLEELGRGAMGVVYKGMDPTIGRIVALKTLSAVGAGADLEQYRARFLIEARSAGRLNHPGIVSVYDVTDDESGRPSLVLEFVDGVPLDKLLAEQGLAFAQTLDVVCQVARALDYAHGHGIVHRDVKPANIMVTPDGQAKLSDFGIAKIDSTSMTMAGQVLGTPAFMSPEQCTGAPLDQRSDIFSLGAVLYTACTGQRPFPGETFTSVAYNVVHEGPPPPSTLNPALPAELDAIVARCLAKLPDDRYRSAAELAAALDRLRVRTAGAAA